MRTICFVLTSPIVLNHYLLDHIKILANYYKIVVCTNTNEVPISTNIDHRVEIINIKIPRKIHFYYDIAALINLILLFNNRRFDAIHSLTPKGGLLGMLAARITQIPLRTHSFTGQVWASHTGFSRFLLKNMDKLLTICATHLNADSSSQAKFLQEEKVVKHKHIQVFGSGSISGVNIKRFHSNRKRGAEIRKRIKIPINTTVFLFLGRLNRDKGVCDLAQAFAKLQIQYPNTHLLFVGRDEENIIPDIKLICKKCIDNISFIDLTTEPETYIDASDVLCLPSYREGFGSSIIEAASMGIPTLASRIYGITDAVVENLTGILFTPGKIDEILIAMQQMMNTENRKHMGLIAQKRAHSDFSSEKITQAWLDYYIQLFTKN